MSLANKHDHVRRLLPRTIRAEGTHCFFAERSYVERHQRTCDVVSTQEIAGSLTYKCYRVRSVLAGFIVYLFICRRWKGTQDLGVSLANKGYHVRRVLPYMICALYLNVFVVTLRNVHIWKGIKGLRSGLILVRRENYTST